MTSRPAAGSLVPGPKIGSGAGGPKQVVVLLRDHAAADHKDVRTAQPPELRHQLGQQRLVARGERTDAHHVHIVFDRLAGRLLRRLKQRPDVDIESKIRIRRRDDPGPAVVPVLAQLGDVDPGAAAFTGGERIRHRADLLDLRTRAELGTCRRRQSRG